MHTYCTMAGLILTFAFLLSGLGGGVNQCVERGRHMGFDEGPPHVPFFSSFDGENPLSAAAREGKDDTLQYLLSECKYSMPTLPEVMAS